MAKKNNEEQEPVLCPVGRFFSGMESALGKESKFFEHLTQSRVEFLKAIRSLVDKKIEDLEKKSAQKPKKKVTKIKVE